jgi:eukaryotic-like serine/threonine-protein kinase
LDTLFCEHGAVSDLSPLKGMPLKTLFCGGTNVCDLSPLRGMPLERLSCPNLGVTDYSPLKDMPNLRTLQCDFERDRDSAILRSIQTLEAINHVPVAEFWKRVDSGESPQSKGANKKKK